MSDPRSRRNRRLSRPRRRRWPLVVLVLILLLAGAAGAFWYLNERDELSLGSGAPDGDEGEGESPADGSGTSAFGEVLAATQDAGNAQVELELDALMPQELDEGVPHRAILGEGVVAADLSGARIDYAVSEVPNSAGYFGHVDGDLSVGYSEDQIAITFPLLVENVLTEEASWLSFELPSLSTEYMFTQGVGQLRELALSDPRIGIALLNGVEDRGDPSGEVTIDDDAVTEYEVDADTKMAADGAPELKPLFDEMRRGLEMSTIPMTVSVDEEERIRRLEYQMRFPAKKGPGEVRLEVRLDLTDFGVDEPELPAPGEVVTFQEYLEGATASPSPEGS